MPGAKIPVLEVERLRFIKDGRGIYAYNDGDVLFGGTCAGKSGGAAGATSMLPAASANMWMKITYVSGTSATETTGYIPIFNALW
jgi:hypothetical protein